MAKRRVEDNENEAPVAKARKSSQASTSKQARQGSDGKHVGTVERFGASVNAHVRQSGAGQVKKVNVKNFMCHSHMTVDFNEHVNFISGPNGSGKSAILQALQYCLGVRATQTGRAQTNAAYLKKGEQVCVAEVTLWNTGPEEDTFEPALYGPTVTIQKTLSEKGSTTTKVLDHRGNKTGLTKADDVRQLLAKLSVNAANPSIVLTQDHARGLLTGQKVNRHLYDLLEESLDYKSTFQYLNGAFEDIKLQRDEVTNLKEARKESEANLKAISERLDDAIEAEMYNQLAEDLSDQIDWARVRYFRKQIAELDESLKDTPERQKQLQAALEEKEQELRDLEAQSAQLGEMEREILRKAEEAKKNRDALRAQRKDAQNKKNKIFANVKAKSEQLQNAVEQKREAAQQIADVRAHGDDQESIDKQMAEWREAHKRASEVVQASQQAFHEHRKEAEDLEAAMNAAKAAYNDANNDCSSARAKVQQATRELNSLQSSTGPYQEAMTFDPQAGAVLNAIQQNRHMFRKPVLGPIGACLALESSAHKYSSTICGALKQLLSVWIVDSREDQRTFMQVVRGVCRQEPKVYIMRYDMPPHKDRMRRDQLPVDSITTIFNVLRVKPGVEYEHVIMNLLIDHAAIERIGLAEDERAGQDILNDARLWHNMVKLLCNAPNGPVEMTRRGQNTNIWPWGFDPPESLLSADKSEIIASRQRTVQLESQHLLDAEAFVAEKQQELKAAQQARQAAAQSLKGLQDQVQKAKKNEQHVSAQRPEVKASADDELAEAVEARDMAEEEVNRLTAELNDVKEQYEHAKLAVEEVNQAQKEYTDDIQHQQQQLEGQLTFMQQNQSARGAVQQHKDALVLKMGKADKQKEEDEKTREQFEAVLEQHLQAAQATCTEEEAEQERPLLMEKLMQVAGDAIKKKYGSVEDLMDDKSGLESIANKIRTKGKKLEQRAKGTRELLEAEKETLESQDGTNRKQAGSFEALVASQMESWKLRKDKYYEIRDSVDMNINRKFKEMLRTGRNWKGKIEVDHESQQVILSVTPHKGASTEGAAAVKDMKSLSGGERSFTCVSFVLSLGQEISTPFFAMDEFDVFMDAVNRKVALTSILKFAWELKGTQFILLSPLDMSVVEQSLADVNADFRAKANGCKVEEMPSSFVKTYAMQPPREGARAHF